VPVEELLLRGRFHPNFVLEEKFRRALTHSAILLDYAYEKIYFPFSAHSLTISNLF
jgi:hypothetical protein